MRHGKRVGGSGSLAAVVSAALAALLLVSCGGGVNSDEAPERAQALSAARPGELLAYVKAKLRARAELRQAKPGLVLTGGASLPPPMVSAEASGAPVLHSGTTVQEAGVDEDDLVKSDGALIYTLDTGARSDDGAASLVAHRRLDDGGIEQSASSMPCVTGQLCGSAGSASVADCSMPPSSSRRCATSDAAPSSLRAPVSSV